MKNKKTLGGMFLLILSALAFAAQVLFGGRSLYVAAANNYDAAVEGVIDTVRRTNDAAVTTRHLLWKEGSTPGTGAALNGAADLPLGTIDNTESSTGVGMTVLLLNGQPRKMVASEEITIGDEIYTAANGKVQDEPATAGTYYKIGRALTGCTADGDIILVETHTPIRTQVVANAADLTALKAALTSPSLLKFLQS